VVSLTRSPLAPDSFPAMPAIGGVRFAAAAAGIKYSGRDDVMLAELEPGTVMAGLFTRSLTASAPVEWCRRALAAGSARAILCNSGNANAFTGAAGDAAVLKTTSELAAALSCLPEEVFAASTGVIGEPLPAERIVAALPALVRDLDGNGWHKAAAAIMTTDTFAKGAARTARIGDRDVTVAGFAKGSGMIAPDMATMLCFLFTDAALPRTVLQRMLALESERTFNCITVDSDTSTSDTLLLAATGAAGNTPPASATARSAGAFRRALREVMTDLAVQVVRDGEGASKLITIDVAGAASFKAARRVGLAIGNSPLVKTAIAGEDANWGRIVMAVGKAGERADRDALAITIGGIPVADRGRRVPDYDESVVDAHLKGREIAIGVDLGVGRGRARTWSCDLTHDYIRINADYRS
jgi:glutamate N-acetyltransferase/amino-acid N-acetyltransferase